MWKKHSVVMLPTNEKAPGQTLWLSKSGQLLHTHSSAPQNLNAQHLYILSDEEIKEGDWMYNLEREPSILKCVGKGSLRGWKKIIATTDKSLSKTIKSSYVQFGDNVEETRIKFLPQPSQSFIKHFVSEYNKGNIITEVMVEYWAHTEEDIQYKINPKDNTINIKPIKDSWSRDEVIQFAKKYAERCQAPIKAGDKWIEENL